MGTIRPKTNIQALRIKSGKSIRKFADEAKVTPATICRIESGKVNPNPVTASKICKALDSDFDQLFEII